MGNDALDVFGEHIEFEVHAVAGAMGGEVCFGEGVGDNPADEAGVADFGDGEADAVHGDAAFGNDELRECGRQRDFEAVILSVQREVEDGGGGVHMALDEMAAHFCAGTERGFEVHFCAGRVVAEIGDAKSFGEEIKYESVVVARDDGEAAAVHSDAVAKLRLRCGGGRAQGEARALAVACEAEYFSCFHDEAGEHGADASRVDGEGTRDFFNLQKWPDTKAGAVLSV